MGTDARRLAITAAWALALASTTPSRAEASPESQTSVVSEGDDEARSQTPADPSTPALAANEPRRGPARWYAVRPDDPRRFSIAAHVETQIVGLAFGPRIEGLYRPFRFDRGANLVLGLGLEGGPELGFLPLSVGWRQHFVPHPKVTLELGAGYEQQTFLVPGLRPISRPAFYAEGGLAFRVIAGGWLGLQAMPSVAPLSRPGPGLAVRVGFRWTLGCASTRSSPSRSCG